MYSKVIYLFLTLSLILTSCTKEEENASLKFRFLEFESDVLLPAVNNRSIVFYGIDFDNNLNNWDLKLVNEDNEPYAVEITSVKATNQGFVNEKWLQKITFKAPPLGYGVYSLAITNTVTGQVYTDHFLVKSKIFNKMKGVEDDFEAGSYRFRYTMLNDVDATEDLYYFLKKQYVVESDIRTSGITGVVLEDRNTIKKIMLDYTINSDNKVAFVIPEGVTPGAYFLSVSYDTSENSYFEKDILIFEEQYPEITSINKNAFQIGDEIILSGSNFRYDVNPDIFYMSDLYNPGLNSALVFKKTDGSPAGGRDISPYTSDESYKMINPEGTELKFTFPERWASDGFEGNVFVRCGPYLSNPIPITINM